MEEMDEMQKIADEIILGNDSNLNKLKEMTDKFFKGKDQQFFDNLDQVKLKRIIALSRRLDSINEISRAHLDCIFHYDKPIRYSWKLIKGKATSERLRKLKDLLLYNLNIDEKAKGLEEWIEFVIEKNIDWDDFSYENIEKDLRIEINIGQIDEVPDITIFIIGTNKYKKLEEKIQEIFKQDNLSSYTEIKNNLREKYLELFNKLLMEESLEKQRVIAKEIANFSGSISKKVENSGDEVLKEINETCLPMEHWKDDTGYCNLNESDIKNFIKEIESYMEIKFKEMKLEDDGIVRIIGEFFGYKIPIKISILQLAIIFGTDKEVIDKLDIIDSNGHKLDKYELEEKCKETREFIKRFPNIKVGKNKVEFDDVYIENKEVKAISKDPNNIRIYAEDIVGWGNEGIEIDITKELYNQKLKNRELKIFVTPFSVELIIELDNDRKFLYLLQDMSILNLTSTKLDKGWYEYKWILTKKGEMLVSKDIELKKLWDSGDIEEFYSKTKEKKRL